MALWRWYDDLAFLLGIVMVFAIGVFLFAMPVKANEKLMGFHSQHHHGQLHHWYQS